VNMFKLEGLILLEFNGTAHTEEWVLLSRLPIVAMSFNKIVIHIFFQR
jgi:hypothetical protein